MQNRNQYPEKYSIAVKDNDGLFQRFSIVRSKAGDIYFNFLGSEPEHNPHISYHQSGATHNKFYNHKIFKNNKQRPNLNFRDTENIVYTCINYKDAMAINMLCVASEFTDVMEIDATLINSEFGKQLSVDLIDPNTKPWPSTYPYSKILKQQIFKQNIPWISVSIFEVSLEITQ